MPGAIGADKEATCCPGLRLASTDNTGSLVVVQEDVLDTLCSLSETSEFLIKANSIDCMDYKGK